MRDNVQKYLYAIKVQITEIMDHTIDTTWAVELNTKKNIMQVFKTHVHDSVESW